MTTTIDRLKKCLSSSEKYFIQVALAGENRTIKVKIKELAKTACSDENTVRNVIDKLEIAGYLSTVKDGHYIIIKITKVHYIKQIFE